MKSIIHIVLLTVALVAPTSAMTNAFTYQGRLSDGSGPATGTFSMLFVLHTHPMEGDGVAVVALPEVAVTNGLFTAQLAFPLQWFDGADRWLAVHVRRASNTNDPFTELTPRQLLAPAPYALLARNVPDGAITGPKLAPGAVTAQAIAPGTISGAQLSTGSVQAVHLAPGAAAANLLGAGQSAIAGGAVVLSESGNNTNLLGAGYVKIGKVELVPESLNELAKPPQNAGSLGRVGHSVIWTGTEYIFWGGRSTTGYTYYNDGARYNPATDTWTYIPATNAPAGRYDHVAVWTGSEMIVYGGTGAYTVAERGARFNPATGTWTLMSTNGAAPLYSGRSAVWAGTHFVVWGGAMSTADNSTVYLNTGARYNPANDTWLATPTGNAPSARAYHSAVWTGTEMIVWGGGTNETVFATGARYNPINNTWLATSVNNAPAARWVHSATWTGTEMIVWGGSHVEMIYDCDWMGCSDRPTSVPMGSGGRYNPANNTWTSIATTAAPSPRRFHSAVWTGSRLVVWGGRTGLGSNPATTDTGGIYNPSTDTWTATSTLQSPGARAGHTAVWTGSRMLVWDTLKFSNGSYAESGGRFDPVANSWSDMSATGDVVARSHFSTVWTGSELLIWGGQDINGNVMRSGLRFDPIRNRWSFMSLANAPEPRRRALATWTGTEMIVWGGEDAAGTRLRTGGRYNPATDSWIDLPTTNSPSQRIGGTAVWAGGHFIVWGGQVSAFLTLTGGKFNPATGKWQPTSLPPAGTQARRGHAGVSVGSSMFVWGGSTPTNMLQDGLIYSPASDTWTQIPTIGAPSGRTNHTVVWTGSEVIIFGGRDGTSMLSDGGSFSLATGAWLATTAAGVASTGRSGHKAVWAYDRLLALGNASGNDSRPLAWSPATDTWTQFSEMIGPLASDVFWTGSEALWWTGDGGCMSYSIPRTMYLYLRP